MFGRMSRPKMTTSLAPFAKAALTSVLLAELERLAAAIRIGGGRRDPERERSVQQ